MLGATLFFFFCLVGIFGQDPYVNVFKRSLPYPVDYNCCESIAYGNGKYVMVSRTRQTLFYTTDKLDASTGNWVSGPFPKAANFTGSRPNTVVYSKEIGFAVCDYFYCWISPDGENWKPIAPPSTPSNLPNLAANHNTLVYIDSNSQVYYTKKGSQEWDPAHFSGGAVPGSLQVTHSPHSGYFYMWTPNNIKNGNLWQSKNGKDWEGPISKNIPLAAIDYGFLPSGETIMVSRLMTNVQANVITVFVTNSTGNAHSSRQVAQWTISLGQAPNGVLAHLALFNGGTQAVVGIWTIAASYNKWFVAPKGFKGKWKEVPMPEEFVRVGCRQGNCGLQLKFNVLNGQLVVIGPGGYILKEGSTNEPKHDETRAVKLLEGPTTSTSVTKFSFQHVTQFVSNSFVLPLVFDGYYYIIPMISYRVLRSKTGNEGTWEDTGKTVLPFGTVPEPDFQAFHQPGLDHFLAFGRFAIYIGGKQPTDPWQVIPLPSGMSKLCQSSMGLAWANGTLVYSCGTDQGSIYSATGVHSQASAVNWKQQQAVVKFVGGLTNVVVGNGLFVVTQGYGDDSGKNTPVYYSSDGVNWKEQTNSGIEYGVVGFAYGNGVFIAVGYYIPGMYKSYDGIHYTKIPEGPLYTPNSFHWSIPAQVFVALDGNQVFISKDGKKWCFYCLPLWAPPPDQLDSTSAWTLKNDTVVVQLSNQFYVTHESKHCYPAGKNPSCKYQ